MCIVNSFKVNSFKHTLYAMLHLCLCVLNCRKSINISVWYLTPPNLKTKLKQKINVCLSCTCSLVLSLGMHSKKSRVIKSRVTTSSCLLLSYFLFLMLLFQSQKWNKKLSGIIFKYFFINLTFFISQSAVFSRTKSIKRTVTWKNRPISTKKPIC